MSIYKGNRKQLKVVVGGRSIKKIFKGNALVFGKEVFERTFTSSGSITFPASMFALTVIIVGGGVGVAVLMHILKMLGGQVLVAHLVGVQ